MAPRFGTDGLRGVANSELTPELALNLGRAAARQFRSESFIIGSDTRESSPMLRAAFAAGVASEGHRVFDVGVIPTPGVAYLAATRHAPGAIISASHNPYRDNGIKLVSPDGTKLDDVTEQAVEAALAADPSSSASGGPTGLIEPSEGLVEDYVEHLLSTVSLPAGAELSIVCDCANGAASAIAGRLFQRFGVRTQVINDAPNGMNINEHCGSTHPSAIADAVRAAGADVGLSFDGDADRLIAVGSDGTVVDGDQLISLFALDLEQRSMLDNHGVVITVMSNLGLRRRLSDENIAFIETPVGDRFVADAMEQANYVLGGEQSGHIIFRREATTGDGMLTGLKLLELIARSGGSLSELAASAMIRFPQELRTIHVAHPERLDGANSIWAKVAECEERLGEQGRVLMRRSGTEAAVRVMVEAESHEQAGEIVDVLVGLIQSELGADKAQVG